MTFTGVIERESTITIDGYSKAKTVKGALKDLAREVAKYSQLEADLIVNNMDETVNSLNVHGDCSDYFIDVEEAPCASRIVFLNGDEDDYSEENTEMEYADGNFYLCIMFVK